MTTVKERTPEGDWIIRPALERPPARVWYRHSYLNWLPVEVLGTQPHSGRLILREVGRPLAGIWLAAEDSEILHL